MPKYGHYGIHYNNNSNNNSNFYFSDMSVYTPSQHHGLQVTNVDNIVMSYVLKTYYKEVWLFYCLGSA